MILYLELVIQTLLPQTPHQIYMLDKNIILKK